MDNQPIQPTPNQQPPQPPVTNQPSLPSITPKRSKKAPIIFTLLLIILLGGAAYGTYAWQHKKVNDSNAKAVNLQSQVDSLKNQVNRLTKQAQSAQATKATTTSSTSYLKITQLGIELPLTSAIADLSYSWDSSTNSATLGSASLLKTAEQDNPSSCTPTNTSVSNPAYTIAIISTNSKSASSSGAVKTVTLNGKAYYWFLPGAGDGCSAGTSFSSQLTSYYNTALTNFSSATIIK